MANDTNELENRIEAKEKHGFNEKLEAIQDTIESLKVTDEDTGNIFTIVVEALEEEGILLPNDKIIEIKELQTATKENTYVIRFKEGISMIFVGTNEVLVKIKEDMYSLEGEELEEYRKKYFSYVTQFIAMKQKIHKGTTEVAKRRLEKFGI
jgi:hypothetical protein